MERSEGQAIAEAAWRAFVSDDDGSADADFFDAGGHSMLLLRMAAWIKSEHNRDLVLGEFLKHPTLGGLARCLEGDAPPDRLHTHEFGSGERTIVCIPGSYGRALAFERLSDALATRSGTPVSLRCYELWNAVERLGVDESIDAVRGALRRDLLDPNVIGIAGYSLGGMFAFSEDFAAERPDLRLWLIDSYPPIPPRSMRAKLLASVVNGCRAPLTIPGGIRESLADRARHAAAAEGDVVSGDRPERWSLVQNLGRLATHPWNGRATLISLRHKPLWTPYYRAGEMNGLRHLIGTHARRAAVPGSHIELLTSGVGGVADAISADLVAA